MKRKVSARILSILLSLAVVFSMMPSMAFADGEPGGESLTPVTANVNFTSQEKGAFLHAPQFGVEVSSDLAEDYGYTDNVANGVSALDVLVKAHEITRGDAFTAETKDNYLVVSDGMITKLFGEATYASGFFINQAYPHDGTTSQYRGYNGYTINTAPVKSGDFVEFFIYQDQTYWSDNYVYIDIEGSMLRGTSVDVTVSGVMCMTGYEYFDQAKMKAAAVGIESAQLAYINKETGILENISDCITNEDGVATFSLPNTPGTYYLTAYMPVEEITDNYASPLVMPLKKLEVKDCNKITVPADATLFVGEKTKHFVPFTEIQPKKTITNADNTKTYLYELDDKKTYNYRVSGDSYITFAGKNTGKNLKTKVIITEMLQSSDKTKDTIDKDVTSNNGFNVADIYLNINEKGHLNLAAGAEYQLIPLRNWEVIDTTTNNYFIEPDFNYEVLDINGNTFSNVVSVAKDGKLTATQAGEAIVLVTYDAMNNESAIGGPFFGAIWPENTGVFVVTVDGTASTINTGMTINVGKNSTDGKLSGDALDAEHDVIYFVGDNGEYTFTPTTEDVTVSVANPTIDDEKLSFNGFNSVNKNDDGKSYTVPLTEGRNIVKIEKDSEKSYQVITAKKLTYTVNDGKPVAPGDEIKIEFDKIFLPLGKLAGVYNPTAIVSYQINNTGEFAGGTSVQYNFASNEAAQSVADKIQIVVETGQWGNNTKTEKKGALQVPADYSGNVYNLTNGTILNINFGDPAGNHRGITLTEGKNPNYTANQRVIYLGNLPDIEIPITKVESIEVTKAPDRTDYNINDVFDEAGMVVTANYTNGQKLEIGDYDISAPDLTASGSYDVKIKYTAGSGKIFETTQSINVSDIKADKIEITKAPSKTTYKEFESFSTDGMEVTVTYSDDTTAVVNNYKITPETLSASDTKVTIQYGNMTAEQAVTVEKRELSKIAITTQPTNKNYVVGDTFDPTGAKITATFKDGSTLDVTNDVTYTNTTFSKVSNNHMVTVSYTYNDVKITVRIMQIKVAKNDTTVTPAKIDVTFTLLGDSKHGDNGDIHTLKDNNLTTWINEKTITVDEGATVLDVLKKALGEAGLSYQNPSGNYVESIRGLGEFDNGANSGWMYTLNGRHPSKGVSEQVVKNGDDIVFHYTDDYTKEQGSEAWAPLEEPKPEVNTGTADGAVTTTAPAEVAVKDNVATATVTDDVAKEAVKQAKENKAGEVVLQIKDTKNAGEIKIQVKTDLIKDISSTGAKLTIETDKGSITVDDKTIEQITKEAAGTEVTIVIRENKEAAAENKAELGDDAAVFSLEIKSGDTGITIFEGKVTVTLPIPKGLLDKVVGAVHIGKDGKLEILAGKKINRNKVDYYEFETGHFSDFALVDTDKIVIEEKNEHEACKALVKDLKITAKSSKTSKGNIKVTAKADVSEIKALGYTVEYRFCRSTKKEPGAYKALKTKKSSSFINTTGKKGTRYYYRVKVVVKDKEGNEIAKTSLKQSTYTSKKK